MMDALLKRGTQAPKRSARARRTEKPDPFIGWLVSQPLSRELLIDILRAPSKYDRASKYDGASLVADAHATHIRALRRLGRDSVARSTRTTQESSRRLPTTVALDADPWSRRVPPVVTVEVEQFQSLLEQVEELCRLSDEVTPTGGSRRERPRWRGLIGRSQRARPDGGVQRGPSRRFRSTSPRLPDESAMVANLQICAIR